MSTFDDAHPTLDLTAYFQSGERMRSRRVSDVVLTGHIDVPRPPPRVLADWDREVANELMLDPGDVEVMPLARTRARWPDYRYSVQTLFDWAEGQSAAGLANVFADSDMALMACRGARYHHDAIQYGGSAFCNLFLSEDKGLDLHFPAIPLRIPLTRGTVVIFDTGQPHAVIPRHSTRFDEADFAPLGDATQIFLTWELPMEAVPVAQILDVFFDSAPRAAALMTDAQIRLNDVPVMLCPHSGQWQAVAVGSA